MTYAFFYDVPGDLGIYRDVDEAKGDQPIEGLLVHLVTAEGGSYRHTFVFETEQQWRSFFQSRVHPAVTEVLGRLGLPAPESVEPQRLELIDLWAPAAVRRLASAA